MQANWSLILNVLLLTVVVIAIKRLMTVRRQSFLVANHIPEVKHDYSPVDDIIAVRRINEASEENEQSPLNRANKDELAENTYPMPTVSALEPEYQEQEAIQKNVVGKVVMMFLLAKENRQLAGYELLQTLLAAGLRFGEGHLFHRHQYPNGQGPVLCSLAAATATGVFDLQNIGAFNVRGLCLFMQASGNETIDTERFSIMLATAKQLSNDLDTHLLDEKQRPLNKESVTRYCQDLHILTVMPINLNF